MLIFIVEKYNINFVLTVITAIPGGGGGELGFSEHVSINTAFFQPLSSGKSCWSKKLKKEQ